MCESCICSQRKLILIWRAGEAACGKCGHGYDWPSMKLFKFDTQVLTYCMICAKMSGLVCHKCNNGEIYTKYHTKNNFSLKLGSKPPKCTEHKYRKVPKH